MAAPAGPPPMMPTSKSGWNPNCPPWYVHAKRAPPRHADPPAHRTGELNPPDDHSSRVSHQMVAGPRAEPETTRAARRRLSSRRCLGGDLLSHPVSRAVPSALEGLTSGFGMGPGVSPPL